MLKLILKVLVLYMQLLAKPAEFQNAKGEVERSKWYLVQIRMT